MISAPAALAVGDGDAIIPFVNDQIAHARTHNAPIIMTQDWHPATHASFADNHDGKAPFDMVEMFYGPQVLWPRHCVQGSQGAAFHSDLHVNPADLVIAKGFALKLILIQPF